MKKHKVFIFLVIIGVAQPAAAYVDPGSGMLMWQSMIALVGAVAIFIRHPREGFKKLLSKFKKRK